MKLRVSIFSIQHVCSIARYICVCAKVPWGIFDFEPAALVSALFFLPFFVNQTASDKRIYSIQESRGGLGMRIFLCLLGHLNADWYGELGLSQSGPSWDEWSNWSPCTDPCGAEGTHIRSRQCRNGDIGRGSKFRHF